MWVVYILKNPNNKYYIGSTGDIRRRLIEHNRGKGGTFTKLYRPWKIALLRKCKDSAEARSIEKLIKSYKGGSAFKKIVNGEVAEWSKAPHC